MYKQDCYNIWKFDPLVDKSCIYPWKIIYIKLNYNNNSNISIYTCSTFCQRRIQSAAAYYYGIRKIVTVILLHLRVQLAKCTPYQHLHVDSNISHNRYLPDAFTAQVNEAIET